MTSSWHENERKMRVPALQEYPKLESRAVCKKPKSQNDAPFVRLPVVSMFTLAGGIAFWVP